MGFPRQEYWSGLPCPPPGDLHDPGIEPVSLPAPALAGGFFITRVTWEALHFLGITFLTCPTGLTISALSAQEQRMLSEIVVNSPVGHEVSGYFSYKGASWLG